MVNSRQEVFFAALPSFCILFFFVLQKARFSTIAAAGAAAQIRTAIKEASRDAGWPLKKRALEAVFLGTRSAGRLPLVPFTHKQRPILHFRLVKAVD